MKNTKHTQGPLMRHRRTRQQQAEKRTKTGSGKKNTTHQDITYKVKQEVIKPKPLHIHVVL